MGQGPYYYIRDLTAKSFLMKRTYRRYTVNLIPITNCSFQSNFNRDISIINYVKLSRDAHIRKIINMNIIYLYNIII